MSQSDPALPLCDAIDWSHSHCSSPSGSPTVATPIAGQLQVAGLPNVMSSSAQQNQCARMDLRVRIYRLLKVTIEIRDRGDRYHSPNQNETYQKHHSFLLNLDQSRAVLN